MSASRSGPKGAFLAPFGLAALVAILNPTNIGYQDLRALAAQAASPPERSRPAMIASPFGTIHAPTFGSFQRPLGTVIPEPPKIRLASLGGATPYPSDVMGAIGEPAVRSQRDSLSAPPLVFPTVDRRLKGDFLALHSQPDPVTQHSAAEPPLVPTDDELEAALRFVPFPDYDISLSLEPHPRIPGEADGPEADTAQPDISLLATANDPDPTARTSRLFFGDLVGSSLTGIVPWAPGEEPILMLPRAPDTDMKRPALAALSSPVSPNPAGEGENSRGGETVAGKGEVTGEGQRPKSPSERLGLVGKAREKAEKCLANAVYFESRGESVRGQIGVAQVVLNRAFSSYYPDDVCGVVYQNAHRHLSCQFTFACDGIPDVVTEAEAWERAKRIARATLDGRVWLPEIGKATHYHAYWVNPWWVRTMRKLTTIGVHTFYRPRRWGDGEEAPSWGTAAATAETAAKL
jgi:spore germination cell wall hydrolase CwlJ-like protein